MVAKGFPSQMFTWMSNGFHCHFMFHSKDYIQLTWPHKQPFGLEAHYASPKFHGTAHLSSCSRWKETKGTHLLQQLWTRQDIAGHQGQADHPSQVFPHDSVMLCGWWRWRERGVPFSFGWELVKRCYSTKAMKVSLPLWMACQLQLWMGEAVSRMLAP